MPIKRTFDILEHCLKNYPRADAVCGKYDNQWIPFSTEQFVRQSELLAMGLMALGLKKGDRVATVSGNRPEWSFVDMALAMTGAVHVPVYPTISEEEYQYIFSHAETRYIFVSDDKLYKKLIPMVGKIPSLEQVFTFNQVAGATNIDYLYNLGKEHEQDLSYPLHQLKESIGEEEMVRVMLSHRNLVSNFTTHANNFAMGPAHKAISFLPLCHIFERIVNYNFLYKGIGMYYVETLAQIMPAIKEVQPHIFCGVPRLLERVYNSILTKGKQLKGIKKTLFFWAVELGKNYEYNMKLNPWFRLKLAIADKLIYSKWRAGLGGNLQIVVSGGAALQPRIARVFSAAKIYVLEGYGLTETSPVVAVSNLVTREIKVGTNGPVLPGVQVKIAEDGEILTKGPNLMMGYYREPELTAEVIDKDGWFHTGDIGILDEGKYLKITDRKKEIFKLTGGKYIAPQMIENKLKESMFIEQVIVIGDHEKFASALVAPNFEYLHEWCAENQILFSDNSELINHPKVQAVFLRDVKEINKTLGQHEEIKRFRLITDLWSPQTGELSQTLKLKRKFIEAKYKDLIEEIFASSREEN
ncbi:MAG: long-chain fatty acid--CoA ligase [Bacteroidia bacterium]|nr:long-chain fatty acid--CoA ligase [Bacteroidia bacterium]